MQNSRSDIGGSARELGPVFVFDSWTAIDVQFLVLEGKETAESCQRHALVPSSQLDNPKEKQLIVNRDCD
jgi:hypothetical protein